MVAEKIFRGSGVIKALRKAIHPNTTDAEALVSMRMVTRLDPALRFLDMIDPDFNIHSTIDEWRDRLQRARADAEQARSDKEAAVTALQRRVKSLEKQLDTAKGSKSSGRSRRNLPVKTQSEQSVNNADTESKVLPFPFLHTHVVSFHIADQQWEYPSLRDGKPESIGWNNVKRYTLEYLWQHGHITTIEELFSFFTHVVEGELAPGNYLSDIGPKGVTLKSASGRDVGTEVQRALKHFGVPFEIVVFWDNVQKPKSHGSAQGRNSQVAAFPGMIARLTNTETADLVGNYPNFALSLKADKLETTKTPKEEAEDPWKDRAIDAVRNVLPAGWTGTGEDVRYFVSNEIGPPVTSKSWGMLILQLSHGRMKILQKTGEHRPMTDPDSHGRSTPVYRRI